LRWLPRLLRLPGLAPGSISAANTSAAVTKHQVTNPAED